MHVSNGSQAEIHALYDLCPLRNRRIQLVSATLSNLTNLRDQEVWGAGAGTGLCGRSAPRATSDVIESTAAIEAAANVFFIFPSRL